MDTATEEEIAMVAAADMAGATVTALATITLAPVLTGGKIKHLPYCASKQMN